MQKFILDYRNEEEYRKLERAVKKYNMLAYKKLNFEYYPELRSGEFKGELISSDLEKGISTYELKLPSDHLFRQVYGDVILKYTVYVYQGLVILESIEPTDIFLEGHVAELTSYKGIMIAKANAEKDKFMVNLFSAMDDSKKCKCNRKKCPTCKGKGYID